jgi:steroid 5-alpha reductase family enzyme
MLVWNFLVGLWVQIWGKRDNSWMDVNYSICFIIPNTYIFVARRNEITARMILVTAIIWFWGVRLAYHIWARHRCEDYRYVQMREGWEAKGTCVYFASAFGFIYLMQGVFATIVNASALYVNLYSLPEKDDAGLYGLWYTDFIGFAIWLVGYAVEYCADRQLK